MPKALTERTEYLTVAQLAELLQISRSQAYELIYRPDFPALVRALGGRSMRVHRGRLEEWLTRGRAAA